MKGETEQAGCGALYGKARERECGGPAADGLLVAVRERESVGKRE